MARLTREESRAQTREKLLRSAAAVFAQAGFERASIELIAEGAGFSKGAVYSNFDSKESLFLELLRLHMRAEIDELDSLLRFAQSPEEFVRSVGMRYEELESNLDWALLASEFQLQAMRDGAFAERFASLYREKRSAMARLIAELFDRVGTPLPIEAEELATAFLGITQGVALQRAADPKASSGGQLGRVAQVFLSSLLDLDTETP